MHMCVYAYVCVCICVCMHMCVYVHVCVCICANACLCICICMCVCVCVGLCMYAYMHTQSICVCAHVPVLCPGVDYILTYIYTHIHICICKYTYIHTHTYIYTYTYIHTRMYKTVTFSHVHTSHTAHHPGHNLIGLPDSGELDFLDSKRPELPKMEQNGRLECREPDSPESGKPMKSSPTFEVDLTLAACAHIQA
jgi:hypothetical protein